MTQEHSFADRLQTLRFMRKTTAKNREWEYWGLDRAWAPNYFDRMENSYKWRSEITDYLKSLRDQGLAVIYADICGRARAEDLGATKNYSFSLQPKERREYLHQGNEVCLEGDIFNGKDFNAFLGEMQKQGDRPHLVTCFPVAGFQNYNPLMCGKHMPAPEVAYAILAKALKKMIHLVTPGGFIFLGAPFSGMHAIEFLRGVAQEEYETSLWLKAIAKELRCSYQIQGSVFGPHYLLRKHKNAK